MPTTQNELTYIDLFAGCGGLSLGLHQAGWKGLFAIEKSPDAFETLHHNLIEKKNHFKWVDWLTQEEHDINEVLMKHEQDLIRLQGSVTLVAGGPPCQGFSLAGLRNEQDLRNSLINSYIKVIELVKPKVLFFENVLGFTIGFKQKTVGVTEKKVDLSLEEEQTTIYSEVVLEKLRMLGYKDVTGRLLDFSDYGVPQSRKRFIIIGTLAGNADTFYESLDNLSCQFLSEKGLYAKTSLEEAISDLLQINGVQPYLKDKRFNLGKYGTAQSAYQKLLRSDQCQEGAAANSHRFVNHSIAIVNRFKYAIDNELGPTEYKRHFKLKKNSTRVLTRSDCTPTLTTLPDDFIHYSEPRILTVREYARIQSFPDWFEFKGRYTTGGKHRVKEVPRYTQIGNAIPPLFGELAGKVLKTMINS